MNNITNSSTRGLWRTPESSTDLRRQQAAESSSFRGAHAAPSALILAACAFALAFTSALLSASLTAGAAWAQQNAGAGRPATGPESFNLTFSLGQRGRSGCLVCHSDKNLQKHSAGRQRSFYISEEVIDASAHAAVSCLGCHLDFNFTTPHGKAAAGFRAVAGLACRNCHARAYDLYRRGVHGTRLRNNPKAPTCADCHGAHDIGSVTKDPQARLALHGRGWEVCGRCHQRYWNNYNDYYHGAAYRRGAPDAPACWQCHRPHDVYRAKQVESAVNPQNLAVTCGVCHEGVGKGFLAYTPLIHGSETLRGRNVVLRYYERVRASVGQVFAAIARQVRAVFG